MLMSATVVITVGESIKYKTRFLTIQEKMWTHRMRVTENRDQWAKSRLLVLQLLQIFREMTLFSEMETRGSHIL